VRGLSLFVGSSRGVEQSSWTASASADLLFDNLEEATSA